MNERRWYGISDPQNQEHTAATEERIKDTENDLWTDCETIRQAIIDNPSDDIVMSLKAARRCNNDTSAQMAIFSMIGKQLLEDVEASIEADATNIVAGV